MSYTKHNFKSGDKLYASNLNEMDEQIYANEQAIADCQPKGDYITETEVNEKIAQAQLGGKDVDLSGYLTEEEASNIYQPKGNYMPGDTKIPTKVSELTNDKSYATESYVVGKINEAALGGGDGSGVDLSAYYTKGETDDAIAEAVGNIEIPETDLSAYYTKSETDDAIAEAVDNIEAPNIDLSAYAKSADVAANYQPRGNYLTSSLSFAGKTLLVTGDSITEANFRSDINWHDFLKKWYNLAEVKNDGYSGSGLVKNNGIVYRIDTWDSKYGDFDMILIMGNMNDGTTGVTGRPEWLGTFEDQEDSKKDASLYGALHYTLRTLTTRYPSTPIGWIISQPRSQVGDQGKCWGTDGWFEKWTVAIKEVCGHYSIPVLDLYHESNVLRPWIPENNKKYFSCSFSPDGDGIHPNGLGQEVMAKKIYGWMNQYMEADFTGVSVDREEVKVSSVELVGSSSVGNGGTVVWTAVVTPSNATNPTVNWSASNSNVTLKPAVETFGATCEIRGLTNGSCDITVTTVDGGFAATKTITIEESSTPEDPTPEVYDVYDDFNRADNESELGNANTGEAWSLAMNSNGGMRIHNNMAKGNSGFYNWASITVGSANHLVEATITPESGKQVLLMSHIVDNSNYITARIGGDGCITLLYKEGGSNHEVAKTSTTYKSKVKLGLEVVGTDCKVYADGVQILEGEIDIGAGNTVVGFSLQDINASVDDFRVVYK